MPKTDNANYLWINLFYSSLNSKGRAGFVMANSASDAGDNRKWKYARGRDCAGRQCDGRHWP
jgi:type I restriction-modification system DNA methylase subunit